MRTGFASPLGRLGASLLAVILCALLVSSAQAITANNHFIPAVPVPEKTAYSGVLLVVVQPCTGLFAQDNPVDGSDPSGKDDLADTIEAASNFDSLPLGSIAVLKRTVATRLTVSQRSASYLYDDFAVNTTSGAIPCRWFRAAQIVTDRMGVGAADYSFSANGFQLEPATATYLQTVNKLLFVWNTANFLSLVNGQEIPGLSGKRGKDLDYGLVDFEQKKVDTYTGSYFSDSSAKKAAVANINALTESSFAPDAVRTALLSRFTSKGKTYSFDSLNDREQLGYGIVDWVYQFTSPLDYASGYH